MWDRDTHPEDIYRMKGVVQVEGSKHKHSFQVRGTPPRGGSRQGQAQARGARMTMTMMMMMN